MLKYLLTLLTLIILIGLLPGETVEAFDPNRKPQRWAYDLGLINQEYAHLQKGLVGHWIMWEGGGEPRDISSWVNHLTSPGGTSIPTWIATPYGPGTEYDGSNDYWVVPHKPSLDPGDGDFTFIAYLKSDATGNVSQRFYYKVSTSGTANGFYLSVGDAQSYILVIFSGGSGFSSGPSTTLFTDNRWHVVAGVLRGDTREIWVDGVLENSDSTGSVGSISTTSDGAIGRDHRNSNRYFDGSAAWARLYTRALTPAELRFIGRNPHADLWMAEHLLTAEQVAVAPSAAQIIIISLLGGGWFAMVYRGWRLRGRK